VFNSRSFMIIVMKFAGINANAIEMKKTKLLLFLVALWFLLLFVNGNGELEN